VQIRKEVRVTVFNATFNNISVILLWSDLLVEEIVVCTEYHQPVTDKLYHINVVLSKPHLSRIPTHNFSGERH